MKRRQLTALGLLTGLNLVVAPAFAQAQPELDLTIRVMEEGQQPDGFINQIELPPPEAFEGGSIDFDLSDSLPLEDAVEETRSLVDSVEETVSDQVRETISIDGSAPEPSVEQPDMGTDSPAIPESVERILAEDLPLAEPLNDVVDLDDLVDVTADVPTLVDTVELDSSDLLQNGGDTLGDLLDAALTAPVQNVDELGTPVEEIEALGGSVEQIDVLETPLEELNVPDLPVGEIDAPVEVIESLDAELVDSLELPANEPDALVDSLDGLLPETEDSVEIDTDSLLDAPLDTPFDTPLDSQELDQLPGLEPEPVEDLLDSLDAVPNL